MADVQKYFCDFHNNIKLEDESEILRNKRDIILNKLKENKNSDVPKYTTFNQGSYAMCTGVKPVNGDYDIDVGIHFEISKDECEDPIVAKKWVFDALEGHTKDVRIKNPCVTVQYQIDDEPIYHVDLAIYSANNNDGKIYIAKGKPNSAKEHKKWEESDPKTLIDLINKRFSDKDEQAQFRRLIRYMKRWKEIKFSSNGHAAPTGIAITVAAYNFMNPEYTYDIFANKKVFNDLKALKTFVSNLVNSFTMVYDSDEEKYVERIKIKVMTPNYNDLFEKMTNKQMSDFKLKLESLLETLRQVEKEVDPVEACRLLVDEFGEDFPVPPKEKTAEVKKVAVISSNQGA